MDKQRENLEARLEVATRIRKNAALQKQAIKDNEIKLLGKLLKRQQGNIDKLLRLTKSGQLMNKAEKEIESKQQEEALNSILSEAIQLNAENIACAEALKTAIGKNTHNKNKVAQNHALTPKTSNTNTFKCPKYAQSTP
jgi:hypothetical protein